MGCISELEKLDTRSCFSLVFSDLSGNSENSKGIGSNFVLIFTFAEVKSLVSFDLIGVKPKLVMNIFKNSFSLLI